MPVRAKICGLSTPETVGASVRGGASHLGFVFFARSPRNVAPEQARALIAGVPAHVGKVGVFVDPDDDLLAAAVAAGLDAVQLHGSETPERAAAIHARHGVEVWKAIPVKTRADLAAAARYRAAARRILYDARTPPGAALPGGMGLRFDWALLAGFAHPLPCALSGGLDAANVAEATQVTRATLVDVSSGVESAPGVKAVDKIAAFLQAVGRAMSILPASTPAGANSLRQQPDTRGHFGDFGGRYVAETLMPLILDLEREYRAAQADPAFAAEFDDLMAHYVGRPSPLYHAERLTEALRESVPAGMGAKVYLKRDELNHTGAHKINNCIGQILLAVRMGKTRIIAETGAGQHGVATATVAARFGLPCTIFMGAKDVERQQPNVFRMKLLGAEVRSVSSGSRTLKDAMNEALRDWVANMHDTFYIIGTAAGPHPYPELVRDFQSVIGREARAQILEREGRLPDLLVAAIGGGSNAIGLFHPFLDDAEVAMLGVEAAGHGLDKQHAASLAGGEPGILHGNKTFLLQDADGQIAEAHSISAGLDYPGIGPEHSWLHSIGRVKYESATDRDALDAFQLLCRTEGIIPALEPSHALAAVARKAREMRDDRIIVANLCGRGDKDIFTVAHALGVEI